MVMSNKVIFEGIKKIEKFLKGKTSNKYGHYQGPSGNYTMYIEGEPSIYINYNKVGRYANKWRLNKCYENKKDENLYLNDVEHIIKELSKLFRGSKATAYTESKQFYYKGQTITASSKEEAIQKIVASDNFVGAQKFTKAELKKAWDELVKKVENDPENKKYPPDNGYDIRNGYTTGEDKDICGKEGHDWDIAFDYEDVLKEISKIKEVITFGDLEVYWNSNELNMADPDNHGIFIEDGKIKQVY